MSYRCPEALYVYFLRPVWGTLLIAIATQEGTRGRGKCAHTCAAVRAGTAVPNSAAHRYILGLSDQVSDIARGELPGPL